MIAAQTPDKRTQNAIAIFTAGSIVMVSISEPDAAHSQRFPAAETGCRLFRSAPAECGGHAAFARRIPSTLAKSKIW